MITTPPTQQITPQQFEQFVNLPENADTIYELVTGEIVKVPSNPYASKIAAKILTLIGIYLLQNDIGHLTGEAGGYRVGDGRFAPDVAFIAYERQLELADTGYNPNPPDLAVEVISNPANADEQNTLRRKLATYLQAGVTVWIVNPVARIVEVYEVDGRSQNVDETGTLTAESMLPGFELAVKDIFPQPTSSETA